MPPLNLEKVNLDSILELLLDQYWHGECEIIPEYIAPYQRDNRTKCVIRYKNRFLRYSQGPKQRYFWDIYGDDFLSVELAIMALSQAPSPK
jgi:hypothetical protein